jgi:stress response protein YsnF
MPDTETVRTWQGRTLLDRDGSRIGTIDAIYLDDRTGQPEWALVNTGLFGTKASFVPLVQAFQSDNDVLVPYDKQLVRDAPRVDVDQRLSEAEEQQLWRHYGLDYDTTDRSGATGRNATSRGTVGRDVSGPTTDDAMTRSEEELRVGTAQRERGRVRLRKYVTTEQVQQTVPVRREKARLREEEPVVEKRVVPRERVRLDKDTMTGEERVAEEVHKEQIEVQDEDETGGRHERRRRR